MTPNQILIVVIRLLSIVWTLFVLAQIGSGAVVYEQMGSATPITLWALQAVQLAACVFFWVFPATLASKLLRTGSSDAPPEVPQAIDRWEELAFVAIGVFVLVQAVPDLIYWIILLGAIATSDKLEGDGLNLQQKINVFVTLLDVLVGVWLVLGADGIRNFIRRLRRAGYPVSGDGA